MAVVRVTSIRHHTMHVVAGEKRLRFECSCGWLGVSGQAARHMRSYRVMFEVGTAIRFEVA